MRSYSNLSNDELAARRVGILVVDDHTLMREALHDMLNLEPDFEILSAVGDGRSAVHQAARLQPDVVLLDVGMPNSHPPTTVRSLMQVSPRSKVVILTMYDDLRLIQSMLEIGVSAFLHKSISRLDLTSVIRGTMTRDPMVTVSVPRALPAPPAPRPDTLPAVELSSREREVLELVAQALTNRQIAVRLAITEGTVKRHLRNIFDKLGAVSRIDAVNRATTTRCREP